MATIRFYFCEECRQIFTAGQDDLAKELERMGVEFSGRSAQNEFVASEHNGHNVEELEPVFESFKGNTRPHKAVVGRICTFKALIPSTGVFVTVKKTRQALASPPVYELASPS